MEWSWWSGRCTKESTVQTGTVEVKVGTRDETKSVNLQKYWNPKYNPATWPHMVTYTIGFSKEAYQWTDAPTPPTAQIPFGYDNGFIDLVTGWQSWPKMSTNSDIRGMDLWHAAINGRGRFYAVEKGKILKMSSVKSSARLMMKAHPCPTKSPEAAAPAVTTFRKAMPGFLHRSIAPSKVGVARSRPHGL